MADTFRPLPVNSIRFLWERFKNPESQQNLCLCCFKRICSGRDSNPHPLRDQILSLARLPISPPERVYLQLLKILKNPLLAFVLQFVRL